MSRANPIGTVDVRRYTVERNGRFVTLYSAAGAVGAACCVCPDLRPPSWVEDPNPSPYARRVIVNGCAIVSEHRC